MGWGDGGVGGVVGDIEGVDSVGVGMAMQDLRMWMHKNQGNVEETGV